MLEDITAQELKEKFNSNKNLRITTYIVGGLAVLTLGYFVFLQFVAKPANEDSKDEYWEALNYAVKDSTDASIPKLKKVVNNYDGYVGGEVAQFVYARQLMKDGQFKKALAELEGVETEDTYVSIMSIGLQGDCYSEMDNHEKAANLYLQAADMTPNDFTTPMYLKKAGLCAEKINNYEKAAECYQRIKDDYPAYSNQNQIEKYLARAQSTTVK